MSAWVREQVNECATAGLRVVADYEVEADISDSLARIFASQQEVRSDDAGDVK